MVDNTNGKTSLSSGDEKIIDYIDKLIIKDSSGGNTSTKEVETDIPFDEQSIKKEKTNNNKDKSTFGMSHQVKTDEELKQVELSSELSDIMKRRRSCMSSSVTGTSSNNDLKQTKLAPELELLMKRRQSTTESSSESNAIQARKNNEQLKQVKTSKELEEIMEKKRHVNTKQPDVKNIFNGKQNSNEASTELKEKMNKQRLAATSKKYEKKELKQFNVSSELDAIMKKKRYGQATELEKRELQSAISIRLLQSSKTLDKNAIAAHNKSDREILKTNKVSSELEAAMERKRLQQQNSIKTLSGVVNQPNKYLDKNKNELSPELQKIMKRRQSDAKSKEEKLKSLDNQGSLKHVEMSSELECIMERRKRCEEM